MLRMGHNGEAGDRERGKNVWLQTRFRLAQREERYQVHLVTVSFVLLTVATFEKETC